MPFPNLPNEILQAIASKLDEFSLKSLLECCPHLTALMPLLDAAILESQKHPNRRISALHWAAEKGFRKLASILLANGTSINVRDGCNQTPLHHAVLGDNELMAQFLLSHPDIDISAHDDAWQTAFHCAALSGRVGMVMIFLDHGVEINQGTYQAKQTALHFAVQFGNLAVAELLLRRGADIDRRCERGKTALHWAAQGNHVFNRDLVPGISLLIENGADVTVQDQMGNTALHVLAQCYLEGAFDAITLLLEHGAGIDVQNKKGKTALHVAALDDSGRDSPDVLNLLLDEGADIGIKDSRGLTALETAVKRGFRFTRRNRNECEIGFRGSIFPM
ncbi:uncharacterized protein LAJ45_08931 [Morchella importuna]|nr:uncharacterized protein LAJ45_08931 [Morchella importuna]KAH8147131.1 hypothetical protein LAJ45_08931 [Morchella importuna]